MFIRREMVERAVEELSHFHPFFGITFLVCKQGGLPVGRLTRFPIANAEELFLKQFFQPAPTSAYYFQPFRISGEGRWLSPKYPSSGSQSTRTRGQIAKAFLHERRTDLWGWSDSYVESLREKLEQDGTGKVPAFWLGIWLYRNRNWPERSTPKTVTESFIREFGITSSELTSLFDTYTPKRNALFTSEHFDERTFLRNFPPAPDATPEEGGTLLNLELEGVGPAQTLIFAPGRRLSVITGDNGLGKTFLLECAWWSLTGLWAEREASPFPGASESSISFSIESKNQSILQRTVSFDLDQARWPLASERPTLSGLIVYARVDGSFAIWDPARLSNSGGVRDSSGMLVFNRDQVLNGYPGRIEGLIRDWVRWQNSKDQSVFQMFEAVLLRLSPPDMAPLKPGDPTRVLADPRDIPTIVHDYGVVALTNESAGVRRIITIAYLLVWAWNEHKVHSSYLNKEPQSNVVVMIDEVEAHLHPKWQRVIVPALLQVTKQLSDEVNPQMIVATHSPLVLASIEDTFLEGQDSLFHLHLNEAKQVVLDELDFVKRGTIDEWLTSDVFELKQPRSKEGELALEAARRLLRSSSSDASDIRSIDDILRATLPAEDRFWPRWSHYVKMKGAFHDLRDTSA